MRIFSKLTASISAAALVVAASSPAAARGWHNDWHRHDRGPSAGEVIGTVAAVGLIAAIVSAASSKPARSYEAAPPTYTNDDPVDNLDRDIDGDDDGARYDSHSGTPRYDDGIAIASAQDIAVDACVVAARDEASRSGDFAEIKGVGSVSAMARGWNVTGQVEQRASYRAADGWARSFSCVYADGRVSGVTLN